MNYSCCAHCGGIGDPMRGTDNPIDGLPDGCGEVHDKACEFGCNDKEKS